MDKKYILGVDFETTGLVETEEVVTEIGAVLWDCDAKMPVSIMSELVTLPEGKKLTSEIVELTGITEELLKDFGSDPTIAFNNLNKLSEKATYIMAHNADFDKKFYDASVERLNIDNVLGEKKWIDSLSDVDYPKSVGTRKLAYLATEHGFINPFSHRAVFDVLTMFNVVKNYNIEDIISNACDEKYELKACVSFDNKQKAKDTGFHWVAADKELEKKVGASKISKEVEACDFTVHSRKAGEVGSWKPA